MFRKWRGLRKLSPDGHPEVRRRICCYSLSLLVSRFFAFAQNDTLLLFGTLRSLREFSISEPKYYKTAGDSRTESFRSMPVEHLRVTASVLLTGLAPPGRYARSRSR